MQKVTIILQVLLVKKSKYTRKMLCPMHIFGTTTADPIP